MREKWKMYGEGSQVDPSNGKVFFIRHGESEADVNRPARHTREVKLTSLGRRQALEIAQRFLKAPDQIITSSYVRAKETARPTIEKFLDVAWGVWPVHEFTYLGSLDGKSCTLQERRSLVRDYWLRCDPFYRDNNAESFAMFIKRVREVLNRIWERPDGMVIFTHEQFIIALQGLLDGWISDIPTKEEMQRFHDKLQKKELSHPYGQIVELPECFGERKKYEIP